MILCNYVGYWSNHLTHITTYCRLKVPMEIYKMIHKVRHNLKIEPLLNCLLHLNKKTDAYVLESSHLTLDLYCFHFSYTHYTTFVSTV